MPVVWSDRHRLHDPGGEVWVGVRMPGTELPARAERIHEALADAGARFVDARAQPDDALLAVHDPELLAYLAHAWEEWEAAGLTVDPGQDRVVPYLFPHPGLFSDRPPANATAITARAGQFAYDTMTLIGPGTWEGARAAVDAALTATDLVLAGERAAYACCRPPGHHATRACFGGSCYLNNSAAAAARLREALDGPVAIIDIDAHHGNGTQAIFYEDPDVLVGSVHVDPGAGWFPHFLGFAAETGGGDRRRRQPQRTPGARLGRRAVAGGRFRPRDLGPRVRCAGSGGRARRRRRRRRPGEPAARDSRPPSGPRAGRWGRSRCQPWWSRRAAMTSTRSEAWSARHSPASRKGSAASDHPGASSLEAPRTDPRPAQGSPRTDPRPHKGSPRPMP